MLISGGMLSRTLATGAKMPALGLGTWKLTGTDGIHAVKKALEMGYIHIDTAERYGNEAEVGKGIALSGVPRKTIFLTSKLWLTHYHYDAVFAACKQSLKKLNTDYLDLYLIHWPHDTVPVKETLRALNELVASGAIRNIGVSNFSVRLLEEAQFFSKAPLVVNQIECHPLFRQEKLLAHAEKNNRIITCYSPLGRGTDLVHPIVQELAAKYKKTPSQICLRWQLDRSTNTIVIPKATSQEHLKENAGIFDWKLSSADMKRISGIKEQERVVNPEFAHWDDWE